MSAKQSGQTADADRGRSAKQNRIVYVHGSGPQLRPSDLKVVWDQAILDHDLGELSKMAYWKRNSTRIAGSHLSQEPTSGVSAGRTPEEIVIEAITKLSSDSTVTEFLGNVARKFERKATAIGHREAIPLAAQAIYAQHISAWLAREFLPDLCDYLFDDAQREYAETSVIERLLIDNQRFVVIAHELGAIIAYRALQRLASEGKRVEIPRFITIGSPIGMPPIIDLLRQRDGPLTVPAGVDVWVNIGNPMDPLGVYRVSTPPPEVVNQMMGVDDSEFELPQAVTKYLRSKEVRNLIRQGEVFGTDFGQVVSSFCIAKDVIRVAEDGGSERRQEVLVEYADIDAITDERDKEQILVETLREVTGPRFDQTRLELFERFAAARLTRQELEELSSRLGLEIKIWRDAQKSALLYESIHTIQAFTAHRGYDATGRGIGWAILDTGLDGEHPHFRQYKNVAGQWDCTERFAPGQREPEAISSDTNTDVDGHGTHVAGIIAGAYYRPLTFHDRQGQDRVAFAGVAPECKLYSFKVLKDNGAGRDSFIIKALDHIARINDRAKELKIHGVNLSLGGPFTPEVYGCGHSPICRELRRLWNQGVVICIAAGNEGLLTVQSGTLESRVNRALSIDDPANLDEAIAVGSIHKSNPFTYGISYFSSRGPTADGRVKPDLVAPGERILSAKSGGREPTEFVEDLYVELSGTSMAAPHVSGLLAAFLSRRREFVGYPEKAKQILLHNCENLGRDPYFQGHGMPNLVNMLLHTQLAS